MGTWAALAVRARFLSLSRETTFAQLEHALWG
jgi:hypothetical protein